MPTVPIILLTYNRLEYTMQVISAFRNHLLYPNHVIVIDNGSTDGTVEYLKLMKELGFVQNLILNKENLGIAEPKNQGIEVVNKLAEKEDIKYVCITDNDIVPPFIRDTGCVLEKIVQILEKRKDIGMCGVELSKDNAPGGQEWWWRLRQHPLGTPTFTEISIGFWFAVTRYEYFKEFSFSCDALYGRVDESFRNWIGLNKKSKVGLLKGVSKRDKHGVHLETIPKAGLHLGWTEDFSKYPDYVNMKKAERFKVEQIWKEKNKVW